MGQRKRGAGARSTMTLRREGVVRAIEAMRLRLAEQVSLRYLAKTAAMSPSHFDRVFHQVTGLRPFQFLAALRLAHARDLVLGTNAQVAEICFDAGYNSLGTFIRRFTASIGVSPQRLRRLSRSQDETAGPGLAASRDAAECRADIVVRCQGAPDDAQIFVGAFPAPLPIGRPQACAASNGTSTLVLRGVPRGSHYLLAMACPASAIAQRSARVETFVGMGFPAPVQIEDRNEQEVMIQLRPVEATDPPVVSYLPLLVHESRAHRLAMFDGE
jgi:AraC family transcriptional regulator